ncbi:Mitochondrial sodium/hydrogen exchanger NHA2, partial [Gryllus bimaculatus]
MGCAGFHNSAQCPIQDTQPKCANCTGAHPANYRECSFHLEALRVRNQQLERLRAARKQRNGNTPALTNAKQRTNFPSLATPAAPAPQHGGGNPSNHIRLVTSFLIVSGGTLNLKEMFFVAISWFPKATVQVCCTFFL